MAEDHNEGVSNTPLDLLINAIAGNHYPIPDDHTHGHDHDHDVSLDHLLSQRKDSAEDSQQHAVRSFRMTVTITLILSAFAVFPQTC